MEARGTHSPAPLVSVVTVCMNRPDNLYPCLLSIRKHCRVSHEVFVVAYRFSEENLTRAKADFPEVKFIESNEVRGFSENNNLALRQVRGRFCFVLNDDTELRSDVPGRLAEDFSRLPDNAAIVTPACSSAGALPILRPSMCCSNGICTANPRMTPSGRTPSSGRSSPHRASPELPF